MKLAGNRILENKVQNSSRRLSSSSCSRAIFLVCPFSMFMFQYCVKDQWRTLSIKRCPFSLFLPNVSFCCQDEKDINDLLEECRCGGKYQYIIQRTEREREGDRYKGACFYSVYNSFFIFEKKTSRNFLTPRANTFEKKFVVCGHHPVHGIRSIPTLCSACFVTKKLK